MMLVHENLEFSIFQTASKAYVETFTGASWNAH